MICIRKAIDRSLYFKYNKNFMPKLQTYIRFFLIYVYFSLLDAVYRTGRILLDPIPYSDREKYKVRCRTQIRIRRIHNVNMLKIQIF